MTFNDSIERLNSYLEADARQITNLLNEWKTNPIAEITPLDLNAFDCVVPFNTDPVKGTSANKQLFGRGGNYIFVMKDDYTRPTDFNNVYSGAPLKNLKIKTFVKNQILYLGTAQKFLARMHQHFSADSAQNKTGSLKLGSNERSGLLGKICIYAFCIKKKYKDYYSLIGPKIEKYLHEELPVLMGND